MNFVDEFLVLPGPEEGDEGGALLDVVDFVVASESGVLLRGSDLEDDVSSKSIFD